MTPVASRPSPGTPGAIDRVVREAPTYLAPTWLVLWRVKDGTPDDFTVCRTRRQALQLLAAAAKEKEA